MSVAPSFDPARVGTFRFLDHALDADGHVALRYALDDAVEFVERIELPVPAPLDAAARAGMAPLVALLHLVAGVSYYKAAAPPRVAIEYEPLPAGARPLLEALYSQGLGEFAYRNGLADVPRPSFSLPDAPDGAGALAEAGKRTLVPVGGGKDSVVALEIIRRSGRPFALFSVGDAGPIASTAEAAGVERLVARRRIDPALLELNAAGALNGHVPVTAIVSLIALLTAAVNGFDAVAMANERSASAGNLAWRGIDINHQFSKGLEAELLLRDALAYAAPALDYFSVLRPATELAIARAFARLPQYHGAFTSCNKVFRLDPGRRAPGWCCDCPKCRFVFLALAPFMAPADLVAIFGTDMLDDPAQYDDFALLTATGGHKPFECVGEEGESVAAFRLLAEHPDWRAHAVVARFAAEELPRLPPDLGRPESALALRAPGHIPADVVPALRAVLGA